MAGQTEGKEIQSWSDFAAAVDAGKDVVSLLGLDVSKQGGTDSMELQQSNSDFCKNLTVDNIGDQPLHFVFSHTSLDQKLLNLVYSSDREMNSSPGTQVSQVPATLAVSPPAVVVAELFATGQSDDRGKGPSSKYKKSGDKVS